MTTTLNIFSSTDDILSSIDINQTTLTSKLENLIDSCDIPTNLTNSHDKCQFLFNVLSLTVSLLPIHF